MYGKKNPISIYNWYLGLLSYVNLLYIYRHQSLTVYTWMYGGDPPHESPENFAKVRQHAPVPTISSRHQQRTLAEHWDNTVQLSH